VRGRNLPDSLEDNQTTSNTVRSDLHNVDLAYNPRCVSTLALQSLDPTYCRIPIPAPLHNLARAQTDGDLAVLRNTQPYRVSKV
jgi:hypothetical protein